MPPQQPVPREETWRDRLRRRFERFLSGRAPTDPLYLSNRSWKQKLKLAALIGLPVVILAVLVTIAATDTFHLTRTDPYERPVSETRPAPPVHRTPDPKLTPKDLEVVDIHIDREATPPVVTGVVRNNTGQNVDSVEVIFYLADERGSLMGSETTRAPAVGPHGTVTFHAPLKSARAQYVTVREVRAR